MDDHQIVALFRERNEAAIEQTAEAYGMRLRALSLGIVRDQQTAEECENDTYQHAWNAIPPQDPSTYLYAFLATITRRISLNRCRYQQSLKRHAFVCELTHEMEECLPSAQTVMDDLEEIELRSLINTFLASLPADKRGIFVRRYWYLDSVDSIARRYGLSQSNVKTTLFRVRKQLREVLEKEGYRV